MMRSKLEISMKNKVFQRRVYSVLFITVVFTSLLAQLFVPVLTLDTISEKYLWKKSLIDQYRSFKYGIGDRVFADAVVGEDGWLFFTGNLSLRNYQKVDPLNVSNIKKLVNILNQINAQVTEYGGTLVVVIPPDKSTIYPQYMPEEIPVIGTVTSLDRLIERLNKSSDIQLIDLRPVLTRASETTQVYYKTDTHWNCAGAFYAYKEILSRLAVTYPDLHIRSIEDFTITSQRKQLDLAKMIGTSVMEDLASATPNFDVEISTVPDPDLSFDSESLRVVSNSNADLPKLMVFHDSFYVACLSAQLETAFGSTVSVPYNEIDMDEILRLIETEQPDVVVVEFVERFKDYFLWRFTE